MLKQFLIIFISFNILVLPAYCSINDDFVEKTLSNQSFKTVQSPIIKDTFVEQTIDKKLYPKVIKETMITDSFAESNKNKNQYSKPNVKFEEQVIPTSNKIQTKIVKDVVKEDLVPIKIRIKNLLSTRQKIDEGDFLEFETLADTKINNKTYPSGSTVKARIETISYNKIWGVPSDLVVGNFSIENIPLSGEISKTGANRSLWLYPTIYLTTGFFGVGLLLVPIRGGHAKIKPKQIYTVYY